MCAILNVDLGVPTGTQRTAMCRGTSLLVCSFLLLASTTNGIGIRGAPDAGDAANMATNEAGLAGAAADTTLNEAKDSGRLVETERKKLAAHLDGKIQGLAPASLANDDSCTNYMIASFPELRVVNYVRLPDMVWRPLVVSGLASPKSVVIDEDRNRVYIADAGLLKIVWYQLLVLPDKTLISDGRQHVAVQSVSARNLALDLAGNLWYSGTSTPVPPIPSTDGIWKQPLLAIDQGVTTGTPLDAVAMWTNSHTGSTPSPLVLDAFNIFYGNDMEGKSKGSVVKASQSVPLADPKSGLSAMADNAESTLSIAVTPTALFYGVEDKVYGVLKTKTGGSCGATGDLCKVVTDLVKKPTAMLWDGDGSIYIADNGKGAIYSFASGSVSPHALDKIIDAGEVWGLDMLKVVHNQESSARGRALPVMLTALLTLLAAVR